MKIGINQECSKMKRQDKKSMLSILAKYIFFIVSLLFMSVINYVHASEEVGDKFRIALGGYNVVRYDSTMSLTDENVGAGASINPIDAFGLKTKQSVFRVDGLYRFNTDHALTFSQYSIKTQGSKTLEDDVDWLDEDGNTITIPLGADVVSSLDYDIYKVGYLWSFYHADKVELVVGAGLHTTRVSIGLEASGTYTGTEPRDIKTTVPLPVFSFGITYRVTPKFQWYLKPELFSLKFDDWDGIYTDTTFGMEYRTFEHVSFGLGLSSSSMKLTEKASDYTFNYDNRISGLLFYVAGYF